VTLSPNPLLSVPSSNISDSSIDWLEVLKGPLGGAGLESEESEGILCFVYEFDTRDKPDVVSSSSDIKQPHK
jgi:hypothetical protein